jgi:hypothetical protein
MWTRSDFETLKQKMKRVIKGKMLWIIACCAVPVMAIFFFADVLGSYSWLLIAACPAAHLLMMRGMHSGDHQEHEQKKNRKPAVRKTAEG